MPHPVCITQCAMNTAAAFYRFNSISLSTRTYRNPTPIVLATAKFRKHRRVFQVESPRRMVINKWTVPFI